MGIDLVPHKFEKDTNTGETRLKEVKHYASLRKEGEPMFFLQDGKVFAGEGEDEVSFDAAPDWVRKHIEAMTPETRKAYGFPARLRGSEA